MRLLNPDLWQPWFGGEKLMEFAFLNGILRSPTFPPVDPHFAGGLINYYYFGIYLVAYLIKLTGIYAEVAFNLAIAMLFALTVVNAFAVAYSAVANYLPIAASRAEAEARDGRPLAWKIGLGGGAAGAALCHDPRQSRRLRPARAHAGHTRSHALCSRPSPA